MFLNIFLEVFLIAIIVGGSRYGYNKGFFKMTVGPARLIVCFAVSLGYSSLVGDAIVAPILLEIIKEQITPLISLLINPISTAVAFLLLFYGMKIVISFLVSLVNRIIDEGIIGKINKSLGFIIAGIIAFIIAICFVSLSEYLIMQEAFSDSEILDDFSGGPIYKAFLSISPLRLYISN